MVAKIHILYRTSGSLAFMSLLGALFVIVSFVVTKELRKHPTSMVFFLSICDALFSLKFVITSVLPDSARFQTAGDPACYMQAAAQQFFGLASISWSGMISLNLILQSRRPFEPTNYYAKFYHMAVWGLSIVTSVMMFSFGSIGPSGDGTCWVEEQRSPIRLLFFVPLLLYFSLSISSLVIAAVYSRNQPSNTTFSDRNRKGMLLRMSFYTIVFILCWSGPLAHRIAQVSGKTDNINDPSVLMFLDAIGVSIQGFMNAFIWFSNPSFLKKGFAFLSEFFPSLGKATEKTPLINSLQDESFDPIQFAAALRTNILTCCLRGIALSVTNREPISDHLSPLSQQQISKDHIKCKDSYQTQQPCDRNNNNSNNSSGGLFISERVYTERDLFDLESTSASSHLRFKDYNPYHYAMIRQQQQIDPQEYLESFDSAKFFENLSNQKFSEGKSGSFMCFTPDNKYLIKTVTRQESMLLRKKIDKFHSYFSQNRNSFLLRFYGSYKITMQNDHTLYLSVMSNVFSSVPRGIKLQERYDLKGSTVNRGGAVPYKGSGLGLDNDFVFYKDHLSIDPQHRPIIHDQLKNDAEFLQSLNIMDYSLLIGVIPNQEPVQTQLPPELINERLAQGDYSHGILSQNLEEIYFIGIIDILQLFDMGKKMERFCKVYVVRKNKNNISAIPPDPYKSRFMIRMKQVLNLDGVYNNNNNNNNTLIEI
ncbi:G-protein-coupled receptor family protein [Tieghemostelium lacteum]|uniref:G-protein-coupled receptor family protein n=1 Tax=Tieghemostelium lacteum TaxID=361077 RepID=A0A151ZHB7_TIELA|nr:G-protein-coupled receptor family protein [Tieghemostelium lacteum]|eukprot:KYQ93372.1 G-protein-coupled receptor family protein [Tieghemostelium lacteum]